MSMYLVEQEGSVLTLTVFKDLGWMPNDWTYKFSPDHVRDISETAKNTPKQRSHQM